MKPETGKPSAALPPAAQPSAAPAALSPAQKAWVTRRENGTAPAAKVGNVPAAPSSVQDRGAGTELELRIRLDGSRLICDFGFVSNGQPADAGSLPAHDLALASMEIIADVSMQNGEAVLTGYTGMRLSMLEAGLPQLEPAFQLMKTLDLLLTRAREESDDDSFAHTVATVAANRRITRLCHGDRQFKRGAAYMTVFRLTETFLQAHAKSAA